MRRLLALGALAGLACHHDMRDTGRIKPLEASSMFADGRSARPEEPGTVARGQLKEDSVLQTGRRGGQPVDEPPFPMSTDDLRRGQQRYDIFCAPCHDRTGAGQGMVVQRGFPRPASLHDARLRAEPLGQLYDAISAGYGTMYGFASRIPVEDRWRIAAYLRVLQYSQHAPLSDVPEAERGALEAQEAR